MIVVIDAHYDESVPIAGIGAVVADGWEADTETFEYSDQQHEFGSYIPGQFYLRELPCVLPILIKIMSKIELNTIVIDGYVDLAPGESGLGRHLYQAIDQKVDVVGIAKNRFEGTHAVPVLRGKSKHPLWVTSTDEKMDFANFVRTMSGEHRLPRLVKAADKLARSAALGVGLSPP